MIFAIFVHLVLVSPLGCKAQLDEIALRDMKLFVNGREFIVKVLMVFFVVVARRRKRSMECFFPHNSHFQQHTLHYFPFLNSPFLHPRALHINQFLSATKLEQVFAPSVKLLTANG